ncbi:RloB family protein [Corynebacterium bovis]|nr:RloB family protein [Corynebacterium bovis]MDK8511782.1 RloB family protein [Corynebacterium bovis]
MAKNNRKHTSRTPRTARRPRQLRRRLLVVTEGTRTEIEYLDALKAFIRSRTSAPDIVSTGVGSDPLTVVEHCIEKRDKAAQKEIPYDECFCLVDVDQHSTLDRARERAQEEKIRLLISNLKFEVWLRWHVEDKRPPSTSKQLDRDLQQLGLIKGKHLSATFPISGVTEACATARRADPNLAACRIGPDPSSALPVLIDRLS